MSKNLPITEELDFAYLLALMPALHGVEEFALLPEMFAILGHEHLLKLCKYAGGETLKIPTLEELSKSIDALQLFYSVYIDNSKTFDEIPDDLLILVNKIKDAYYSSYNS